jgi:DNA-binding CsgD family transcriptional regulator
MMREDIEFDADGITLRGWLYTPDRATEPTPTVVTAHGFSAVKEMYLDRFAEAFADRGFAAVVYDNRNFGASDGEPRQEIGPWAHHCGARRIANQARAELITAGAKPRRDAITGRDALTAGELRVARLAVDGLSDQEIAQALFITIKTAKAHLNRVYRKLEITRRQQLVGALSGVSDDCRDQPTASMT